MWSGNGSHAANKHQAHPGTVLNNEPAFCSQHNDAVLSIPARFVLKPALSAGADFPETFEGGRHQRVDKITHNENTGLPLAF
jgi:ribose 5-phosphate isomerase RpiB